MASCLTVSPLLTWLLFVSISGSSGRRQCAELIDDPRDVFRQSRTHTEPLAEYLATDLAECMSICCYEALSCNVGVFMDSSPSDTNCWLYACHPLDSCSIKTRKGAQTFVDPHSTDVADTTTSANTEHSTPAFQDNTVDNGNNDDNTDETATHDGNETYYRDEETSDTPSTTESSIISTPTTTTSDLSSVAVSEISRVTDIVVPTVTAPGLGPEETPGWLVSENITSVSLVNKSAIENDTFTTPGHEDIFKNDTVSTPFNTTGWENDTNAANVSEESKGNNTLVSSFTKENDTANKHENGTAIAEDEYNVENDTNATNVSEESKGNNTLVSSFTNENDTANKHENGTAIAEDEYNVENDTAWLADQLTSNGSSLSLSPSEAELSQTLGTLDQAYYSIRPTWLSEASVVLRPIDTTSYSSVLTEASIFSSSAWSSLVLSTSVSVEATTHLSALDGLVSRDVSGPAMTLGTGDEVSWSLGVIEDGDTDWPGHTQTAHTPEQSATETPVVLPPVNIPAQDSHNHTETRADVTGQPSEAVAGLLISALAVGCVCALAVVGVLSLRLYEGYKKRHYSRLDYLVNGLYN